MDQSELQVKNAIEIAWNPTADQSLKAQAFEYLNHLRASPSAAAVCLSLFTRTPLQDEVVRHFSLEVVNNALQTGQLDAQGLQHVRDRLLQYTRAHYGPGASHSDSPTIQNKLAQTLTFCFKVLYQSGWESFFDDLKSLAGSAGIDTGCHNGLLLYLRVVASVHDEIADQLVNTAPEKAKLYTELKDLIRARDANKIAASWHEILTRRQEMPGPVVELCLKTMSRWVSWVDISLIVNESVISHLFDIASQHVADADDHQRIKIRDAAIDVFTEIIAKKMQPGEKIELIRVINLEGVVTQLISSPGLTDARGSPSYDTDMAETVAKLVNNAVADIVKILDTYAASDQTRAQAEIALQQFVPHLLRFFADEYDEVCSTVIPALTDLLTCFRKFKQAMGTVPEPYHAMLRPILDAIIAKMRYDDTSSWAEEGDETDEAEFQELRKRLRVLQQIIATVDEPLYIDMLSNIAMPMLTALHGGGTNWRDVDLAMHEMYLLGELALRNGGLFHKRKPSSAASAKLVALMVLMMEANVASYPHPAVQLQFMELCIRQSAFFDQHPQYVGQVLEDFVRFVHSQHIKIRARSHHYFLRLARDLRIHLRNVAETLIPAIQDLLTVKAEVPDDVDSDDGSSNEDSQSADALFTGQLHLFEAVGCIASAPAIPADAQASLAQSILSPLTSGIVQHMQAATQKDERAILQVHHLVMAIGTLARGFSDWVPGNTKAPVHQQVSDVFEKATGPIIAALSGAKISFHIRTAARFAFSRMIGVLGYRVLEQLPQWIDGLLAENSTKDEMATFVKLLDQIIFGFKSQIYPILDTLFTPLLQRIFSSLSEPSDGTDADIQLGELRREYLNFLLVLLNNSLESVIISSANQALFETIIASIEHFTRDYQNNPDAKLALAVFSKMASVWGGPDITNPLTNQSPAAPTLPGFNRFMIERFSALTWQLMGTSDFDPKDPNANRLIGEISVLQQMILAKTGQEYLSWLRDVELKNLGAQDTVIDEYLTALVTKDPKAFKNFLLSFLQRGRG